VTLEEDGEDASHVRAERLPGIRVDPVGKGAELAHLLPELVLDAVVEAHDERLAHDDHRGARRDQEEEQVRGEDARSHIAQRARPSGPAVLRSRHLGYPLGRTGARLAKPPRGAGYGSVEPPARRAP